MVVGPKKVLQPDLADVSAPRGVTQPRPTDAMAYELHVLEEVIRAGDRHR